MSKSSVQASSFIFSAWEVSFNKKKDLKSKWSRVEQQKHLWDSTNTGSDAAD